MNTTVRMRASDLVKEWHVVDAAGRPLGRVASEVATLLRGKHKPTFEPHLDGGDFVIVVNAAQVVLTGNKAEQKRYHWHSGYPGGIKTRTWAEQMDRDPARIIEQAVWGMLPKNRLGRRIIRHLKVYSGAEHPHEAQIVGSERARAERGQQKFARSRRVAIPIAGSHIAPAGDAEDEPPFDEAEAEEPMAAVEEALPQVDEQDEAVDAAVERASAEAEPTAEQASDDDEDDDDGSAEADEEKET